MAIVPIAEEVATSTGFLTWIARGVGLAAPLANLLFGRGRSEPARNNSIGPMANWIKAPAVILHDLMDEVIQDWQSLYNTLNGIRGYAYNLAMTARHIAENSFNVLNKQDYAFRSQGFAHTDYLYSVGRAALGNAYNTLNAQAYKFRAEGLAHTDYLYSVTRAVIGDAYNTLNGSIGRVYNDLRADLGTAVKGLRTYADTVSTQAAARSSAKLSSDAGLATHPDYSGALDDLAAAAGIFGAGQPGITNLIGRVPKAPPVNLPAAEAAQGAINRVTARTLRDCVAPLCRDASKPAKDLQSLFGLVEGAAFLAFIAYIIKDPDQAAAETIDVLYKPMTSAVGSLLDLVGV